MNVLLFLKTQSSSSSSDTNNNGGLCEDQAAGAAEALGRLVHQQSVGRAPAEVAAGRRRERSRGAAGPAQRPASGPAGAGRHGGSQSPPQTTVRTRPVDTAHGVTAVLTVSSTASPTAECLLEEERWARATQHER